jgi:hypothetical protein
LGHYIILPGEILFILIEEMAALQFSFKTASNLENGGA